VEGRDFSDHDAGKDFTVAIVNQKFARHFFGDKSPIGRRIGFVGSPTKLKMEIIGVTEDTLYEGPREGAHRQVFAPYLQTDFPGGAVFYIRTASLPPLSSIPPPQGGEIDPAIPVYAMKTLDRQLDETLSTERMIAALSASFGVLATVLAALGLYGVMAFVVARRTREIGLRMALGAPQSQVIWMVMRETLLLVAVGLASACPPLSPPVSMCPRSCTECAPPISGRLPRPDNTQRGRRVRGLPARPPRQFDRPD